MIDNLTKEQIAGIMESLPVDITFIDENDTVKFWNKHEVRIMKRPASALGRNVLKCHPPKSAAKVNQVISDLKSGRRDCIESWIELEGRKISIRNIAVLDNNGKYLGIMEVDQDITDIKK